MKSHLAKLASMGEQTTGRVATKFTAPTIPQRECAFGSELIDLLRIKNGFYAFESALLVRPFSNAACPMGVTEWNAPALWRGEYAIPLEDVLFFAEDVFGGQFCLRGGGVHYFDPETGNLEGIAASLEAWAKLILVEQFNYWTGYTLAHEWQLQNRPLAPGSRLLPKVPFVCEGKYAVENLYMSDDVTGMRFRAMFLNQIRDVRDGGEIIITTCEDKPQDATEGSSDCKSLVP